ncbi:nucleoside triphosphate pyrophosphohydrolase family protein [Gulbenkiania mobilis]|uniref:Phosphoribosyl-ATP pyrophosphohydrolase n=1 Tax=Gulbenkiania mobilis TaxID=397457 RepID=A0ABY2CY15_GULMO|nr:phosphoribosyl-ATP pyrophosphohydrolase [Gulbenkiania mobilis]
MSTVFADRRQFMQRFGLEVPLEPSHAPAALALWETMLHEEWQEFQEALAAYRTSRPGAEREVAMAELTAEGVDLLNVISSLLLSQGLPVEEMFAEIHAANLRKRVNGQVIRRPDGKILKPEGWQAADKLGVIRRARQMHAPGDATPASPDA